MWRKATLLSVLSILMLGGWGEANAMAKKDQGLTLLVVPARYTVLQVAFDVLKKRDAVLVAYQGDAMTEDPLLHAWNGREWVYISLASYSSASFMSVEPTQVILVGDEALLPRVLIDSSKWCPQVMNIPEIDTATLVNSFGTVFAFGRSDWSWFSTRYNLNLADLNEDRRHKSWYDRTGPVPPPGKTVAPETTPVKVRQSVVLPPTAGPASDPVIMTEVVEEVVVIPPAEVVLPDNP